MICTCISYGRIRTHVSSNKMAAGYYTALKRFTPQLVIPIFPPIPAFENALPRSLTRSLPTTRHHSPRTSREQARAAPQLRLGCAPGKAKTTKITPQTTISTPSRPLTSRITTFGGVWGARPTLSPSTRISPLPTPDIRFQAQKQISRPTDSISALKTGQKASP